MYLFLSLLIFVCVCTQRYVNCIKVCAYNLCYNQWQCDIVTINIQFTELDCKKSTLSLSGVFCSFHSSASQNSNWFGTC